MKKSRIICTIGPASSSVNMLTSLVKTGMNVVRINMSHGTFAGYQEIIDNLNQVRKNFERPIALMMDTKGPEIRIGNFKNGEVVLKDKQFFTLTTKDILGDEKIVSLAYKKLVEEVNVGDKIFANNGMVVLKVKDISKTEIICQVIFGGKLTNRKGLNIPGIIPENLFLSDTDKGDLIFAIKNKAEYIASSFVSTADNVVQMRKFLDTNGGKNIKIIAKIENQSGTENIEEIIKVADGIMVARGDLGVEIPLEKIPPIQKKIIALCNSYGKISVVATEMLESMTTSIRPTRAEVSDVANAIYEKASAVMLSGETAVGKHPSLVCKTMSKIICEAEKHIEYKLSLQCKRKNSSITNAICEATCTNAISSKAKAIVVYTTTGNTAQILSSFRLNVPIIAITYTEPAFNCLALGWNCHVIKGKILEKEDEMISYAIKTAKENDFIKSKDIIVIVTGTPEKSGQTNMLKIVSVP